VFFKYFGSVFFSVSAQLVNELRILPILCDIFDKIREKVGPLPKTVAESSSTKFERLVCENSGFCNT
jgi:hypothetical protein